MSRKDLEECTKNVKAALNMCEKITDCVNSEEDLELVDNMQGFLEDTLNILNRIR